MRLRKLFQNQQGRYIKRTDKLKKKLSNSIFVHEEITTVGNALLTKLQNQPKDMKTEEDNNFQGKGKLR